MPQLSRFALRPLALAAFLAFGVSSPMSSNAQTTPYVATDGTLLNISAQGEAKRVPDIATMSTGVVTRAPDANAAMKSVTLLLPRTSISTTSRALSSSTAAWTVFSNASAGGGGLGRRVLMTWAWLVKGGTLVDCLGSYREPEFCRAVEYKW